MCTFEHVHIHERTYIHEYIPARLCLQPPSPVIVLESLCYIVAATYFVDVLGCCRLAV